GLSHGTHASDLTMNVRAHEVKTIEDRGSQGLEFVGGHGRSDLFHSTVNSPDLLERTLPGLFAFLSHQSISSVVEIPFFGSRAYQTPSFVRNESSLPRYRCDEMVFCLTLKCSAMTP